MKYNYINDEYKINFKVPEGVSKIIDLVEKLDLLNDSEYISYASTLKVTIQYFVDKGEITKEQQEILNKRYPAI